MIAIVKGADFVLQLIRDWTGSAVVVAVVKGADFVSQLIRDWTGSAVVVAVVKGRLGSD